MNWILTPSAIVTGRWPIRTEIPNGCIVQAHDNQDRISFHHVPAGELVPPHPRTKAWMPIPNAADVPKKVRAPDPVGVPDLTPKVR